MTGNRNKVHTRVHTQPGVPQGGRVNILQLNALATLVSNFDITD